jgi:hypothetical protein
LEVENRKIAVEASPGKTLVRPPQLNKQVGYVDSYYNYSYMGDIGSRIMVPGQLGQKVQDPI